MIVCLLLKLMKIIRIKSLHLIRVGINLCLKFIERKIKAVANYSGEIKPFPHPRSKKAIKNRAMFWGSSIGIKFAEAFYVVREIEN